MAKDDLYAFHGVILKCDKGATVLPLLTTPKKHAVSKLQIATVTDNIPVVNIPSFGVCSITGSACMPVAPQWLKAHDGAQKVLGQAPLLFSSYCKCQAGGTIEIFPSVDEAMAALENDKESRVDGIPLLDGILGAALTSPIGPILDLFTDGGADVTQGVGRGFRQGLKGTWNGLVQMVSHPVETAKGLTKMVGIAVVGYGTQSPVGQMSTPDQRLKDFDSVFGTDLAPTHEAIGDAIADGWDKKVVNGTTEERSEVVGEVYEGVLEAVVGTKGAGAAVKGVTSAGKFVLGADRMAGITAAIAKLQSAMKLEALAGKVKGIFKVGVKEDRITSKIPDKALLNGEGKIGTYSELRDAGSVGDDITPHHMPSDAYMKKNNVPDYTRDDGLSMNMEQPHPGKGGRHRRTSTYDNNMTKAEQNAYWEKTPREALAHDIKDARKIYKEDGLYNKEIRESLRDYIKQAKEKYPDLYKKSK
ncbi:uncharacterized protein DUF4280 [Pedobacter psychrotolerans]|uniref:Uncharacterized protein DUF4280 n=1 Tax=Pedobacter psychrotolerans TaxID=1843235 RepID=A0A4R2H4S6_9SPHI|nr:DUF4280 domain-containing protein [Pedobacter psychrotolerans]TCO20674.1 uncharacterized protein DUF4280 [Pedobacter psychrotolerans]GGE67226.1 hypothetical protein GCM10011413_37340 [Pedobacter psychrotolerans]